MAGLKTVQFKKLQGQLQSHPEFAVTQIQSEHIADLVDAVIQGVLMNMKVGRALPGVIDIGQILFEGRQIIGLVFPVIVINIQYIRMNEIFQVVARPQQICHMQQSIVNIKP